ncbi:integrin beta-nu [Neodiprion pinetum]|uniref:integrin beta-nu n=1 Tax=Neodiprion pinetum TaxID=441929 RepID=UPI001EDE88D4|nr:integrin beta-nu [Neodiprion pinetum]
MMESKGRGRAIGIVKITLFLIIFCAAVNCVYSQVTDSLSLCLLQTSCTACLEASSRCAWCSDWEYTNTSIGKPRCSTAKSLQDLGCPESAMQVAVTEKIEFSQNEEFRDVTAGKIPVQLRPQKVQLKLRPHSTQVLNLQFRPAKNYPIDLYYLMDLTWSMKDDKDTLVSLGGKLATTLGTFTDNYRVGFGSYADKPLMPYVFPGHEQNPCQSEHATCAPLYAFRHHMRLTGDIQEFVRKVNESSVTGNVDNLEGGLDGVVQAVVCADQVGWAHQARKLMLVATDGFLHFAGDGKLGGAVRRNDLQCHLNADGEYSMSTTYDYPSLAEVSRILLDHKVNVIFAVTQDRRSEYERIATILEEKARVATLAGNSSNILEIVERAYHDIVSKVVLRDNSTGPFALEYSSKCGNFSGPELKTSQCDGIKEGQIYDFKVSFSLGSCPQNKSLWRQKVVIQDALASEASQTEIEIELMCGCDCGKQDDTYCNQGVNECGLCKCDAGWSGETCDCRESTGDSINSQCINTGENVPCSNRGDCICGSCSCDPGYSGRFCQCSPCDKVNGTECGEMGTCDCGSCVCRPGWTGDTCQCPVGDALCIAPGSKEVCGGHGYCDCGQCRCNGIAPDGFFYRGTFCESSAGAGGSGLCDLYEPCVNATVEAPSDAVNLCRTNVTVYKTEQVSKVDIASDHYCFVRTYTSDSSVCTIPYVYEFNKDNTVTLSIGEKICRTPLPAAVVPGVAFFLVVLLGIIALLIWKCCTALKDKREYARFEEEQKHTVYALEENPLFRPATTRFRVPSMIKED